MRHDVVVASEAYAITVRRRPPSDGHHERPLARRIRLRARLDFCTRPLADETVPSRLNSDTTAVSGPFAPRRRRAANDAAHCQAIASRSWPSATSSSGISAGADAARHGSLAHAFPEAPRRPRSRASGSRSRGNDQRGRRTTAGRDAEHGASVILGREHPVRRGDCFVGMSGAATFRGGLAHRPPAGASRRIRRSSSSIRRGPQPARPSALPIDGRSLRITRQARDTRAERDDQRQQRDGEQD